MTINWSSLIADEKGNIDYSKVRQLASVVLALIGGALIVFSVAVEITKVVSLPTNNLVIATAALVLPLTGGKIAEGLQAARSSTPPAP